MKKITFPGIFFRNHQELFFWIGLYTLLIIGGLHIDLTVALITATSSILGMLCIVLINRHLLIRHLFMPHRQIYYYLAAFFLLVLTTWGVVAAESLLFRHVFEWPFKRMDLIYPIAKNSILFLSSFIISTINFLFSKAKENQRRTEQLITEKKDMELQLLKSQINPHFLFNALNNIYSLVYRKDANAPDSILRLSEMLRYITDECQNDGVALSKECKYIENYIDFQRMRIEGERDIQFEHRISSPTLRIPPMILQPFVENCFKHSRIESDSAAYIRIRLDQDDQQLHLITENSRMLPNKEKRKRDGIGISNAIKRLTFSFKDRYTLHIEEEATCYRSELIIQLTNENQ